MTLIITSPFHAPAVQAGFNLIGTYFNGTNAHALCANNSPIAGSFTQETMSIWVGGLGATQRMSVGNFSDYQNVNFYIGDTLRYTYWWHGNSDRQYGIDNAGIYHPTNMMHVVVGKGSNATVKPFYLNGTFIGNLTLKYSASSDINFATNNFRIGLRRNFTGNYYDEGVVSNVVIFEGPVTQQQVTDLYNAGPGLTPGEGLPTSVTPLLKAWYPLLSDGNDYSGQNRHLTLTNTTFIT